MKIWINYEFKDHAWGGGNQFLKALANQWSKNGLLAETVHEADAVLFNSHHNILDVLCLKKKYPQKTFVHRVDGPTQIWRDQDTSIDNFIFQINELLADGTIFQSKWSRSACLEMGLRQPREENVILNAPNSKIFYSEKNRPTHSRDITRVVASGWARSENKGFEVYAWLDEVLCKSKFEFSYVGRVNENFEISKVVGPVDSYNLGQILRNQDIYITASRNDPCSNSLIEALHCGLPAVALNSGGHPEIVGDGGLLFNKKEEIPALLERIALGLDGYRSAINLPTIEKVANLYSEFIFRVSSDKSRIKTPEVEVRQVLGLIDKHHDRSKFRPFKKIRRRVKVALN